MQNRCQMVRSKLLQTICLSSGVQSVNSILSKVDEPAVLLGRSIEGETDSDSFLQSTDENAVIPRIKLFEAKF